MSTTGALQRSSVSQAGSIASMPSLPAGIRQAAKPGSPPPAESASSLRDRICDYFEPRTEDQADLRGPSPLAGAGDGAFKGLFAGGAQAIVGGAAGGFAGVKMGELTGSEKKALATGALTGAGMTMLAASLIPLLMGGSPSALALYLITMGVIGGLSGAASTAIEKLHDLHSIDRPERDVQERGACLDYLSMNIRRFDKSRESGPRGSSLEDGTKSDDGRLSSAVSSLSDAISRALGKNGVKIASILAGAVTGSLLAFPGGPPAMLVGSAVGAVNGFVGAGIAERASRSEAEKSTAGAGDNKKPVSGMAQSGVTSLITAAGGTLAGAAALSLLASNPALALTLGATALVGGIAGLSGTLAGSRGSSVKDGMSAGFMAGLIAQSFTGMGSSLTSIVAGIAAGLGAQSGSAKNRALRGALYGAGMGAALGAFGGPLGAAVTAALGAGIAAVAAAVGPRYGQGVRNLMEDIQKKLTGSAESLAERLIDLVGPRNANIIAGGLSGAFTFGLTGFVLSSMLGPAGFIVPAAVGAIAGALRAVKEFDRSAASMRDVSMIGRELEKFGPESRDMGKFIAGWIAAQSGLQAGVDELRRDEIVSSTMEKMAQSEDQVKVVRDSVAQLLAAGLKKSLDALPTEEEKKKFLDRAIRKDRARLTAEMSARFVVLMSQLEQARARGGEAGKAA